MDAKHHYDHHLAHFYSWMAGDFDTKQAEQEAFFKKHTIIPLQNKVTLDLGSGHGLQSISLAKLGFKVIAVDFNETLLAELNTRKNNLDIIAIQSNLMDTEVYKNYAPELVVCMGDTLTHLPSQTEVSIFFTNIYSLLPTKGKLVLTFRDLSAELKDDQRFIPVKSDHERIHTCFLEYFDTFVHVYDILQENEGGAWKQKISFYPKLRLNDTWVIQELKNAGFIIVLNERTGNLIQLIAEK
jgi:SAM-dependent methyltransferase